MSDTWRAFAMEYLFKQYATYDWMGFTGRYADERESWESLRRAMPPIGSPFWNWPTCAHRVTDPGAP